MESYSESWIPCLKALYWDEKGDWSKAHSFVENISTEDAAWVHAYLHRKEGDEWNAGYWYKRAGKEMFRGSLEQEWKQLWEHFLSKEHQ